MSTSYSTSITVSDYDVTLAIPGEIGEVRARLVEAIQKLGYKVLGEQPIYAKRSKQGVARWDCSINVLDYPTTLNVSLKEANDAAVLATFSYEVKSYMCMTKGDRKTLNCEAEAIIALATERLAISACRACGTQVTDESHFCRRCGAPFVLDVPELEVLRLTRNVRNSYHHIFVGVMAMFLAILTTLPAFITIGGRFLTPLFAVGVPFACYGLFMLISGIWQLHRTLNSDATKPMIVPQPAFKSSVTTALPPAPASVTEATTDLLSSIRDQRVKEPVFRRGRDTGEIDSDHLM